MKFIDFEHIISVARMSRYLFACGGNSKKAMTLYRKNLNLSQELFTVISCFEVALRNAIDRHFTVQNGNDWLKNSVATGKMFDTPNCRNAKEIVNKALVKLSVNYTHTKLLAEMDFGFWRYMFAQPQFRAGSQTLLRIFPSKPTSTPIIQYNNTFVFNQLEQINIIRNRIAHHEPICFVPNRAIIDTIYVRQCYNLIIQLFRWMNIEEQSLLYGLDHITNVCNEIDLLKNI
jgi:hypothetical protein